MIPHSQLSLMIPRRSATFKYRQKWFELLRYMSQIDICFLLSANWLTGLREIDPPESREDSAVDCLSYRTENFRHPTVSGCPEPYTLRQPVWVRWMNSDRTFFCLNSGRDSRTSREIDQSEFTELCKVVRFFFASEVATPSKCLGFFLPD